MGKSRQNSLTVGRETGFVSFFILLAARLLAEGHEVAVSARTRPRHLPADLDFVRFDACVDAVTVLPQSDVWINCIGLLDHRSDTQYLYIHETLVRNLAERCAGYLIQLSALGARPDHPVRFLLSRGRAEACLRQRGGGYGLLRPSIVLTQGTLLLRNLGILVRFAKYLGFCPLPCGGKVKLQPVAGADLAEAVLRLVNQQPSALAVDVVGPTVYELGQLVRIACRAHGVSERTLSFPAQLALPAAWLGALAGGRFLSPEHLRLLKWDNTASPESLTELLGRQPAPIDALLGDPSWYAPAELA